MLLLLLLSLQVVPASAQPQNDQTYVTKVYNISDLLDAPPMLDSKDESSQPSHPPVAMGGGMGGFSGEAAPLGGGGAFRIPENILPQFIGMGGGHQPMLPTLMTRDALKALAIAHLSDQETEWRETAGIGGSLSIVGSIMVVSHTEEVHQRLADLLEAIRKVKTSTPTIQLDVSVVQLDPDQIESVVKADTTQLATLAASETAARLTIRCDNHQTVEICSGLRRSYVMSITPVVGGASIDTPRHSNSAYQPKIETVLLGLLGKMKPDITEDGKSGRISLGIELASAPEEVASVTFGSGETTDRIEIETARLQTSVAVDPNQWTVAGSVTVTDSQSILDSGAAFPHLAVLIHWKPVSSN